MRRTGSVRSRSSSTFHQEGDLNVWMVEEGRALAYRQYSKDYVPQEEAARAAKRGNWLGSFTPPAEYRRGEDTASGRALII